MEIIKELWGKSACGKEIFLYTLKMRPVRMYSFRALAQASCLLLFRTRKENLLMLFSDIRYRKAISVMVLAQERFPADMQTALLSESFLLTESNILFL